MRRVAAICHVRRGGSQTDPRFWGFPGSTSRKPDGDTKVPLGKDFSTPTKNIAGIKKSYSPSEFNSSARIQKDIIHLQLLTPAMGRRLTYIFFLLLILLYFLLFFSVCPHEVRLGLSQHRSVQGLSSDRTELKNWDYFNHTTVTYRRPINF